MPKKIMESYALPVFTFAEKKAPQKEGAKYWHRKTSSCNLQTIWPDRRNHSVFIIG